MVRGCRGWVLLAAMVLAPGADAAAQIVAPAGRTLFNRGVLVRSFLRWDSFETPSQGARVERWQSLNAVVWGAYPHLNLSLVTPLVRMEQGSPGGSATRSGSADSTIFARYDLIRRNVRAGTTRLAPEIGIKLPTGGAFGTGSTDLIGGLILTHIRDPDWIVADVQLTRRGSGHEGLQLGDRLRFDLAYLRRVLPRGGPGEPMLLAVLELNGDSAGRSERSGATVVESGGSVVHLSPGLELVLSRRFVLELSVPVPVFAELNGSQPEPEISTIVGVRWLF